MEVYCKFFRNNDNLVTVTGVSRTDENGDLLYDLLGDATVTVTMQSPAGVALTGQSWPMTLQHVPDSQGDFQGTLSKDIDTTGIESGILAFEIDWEGLHSEFTCPIPIEDREVCQLAIEAPTPEVETEPTEIDILGLANSPLEVQGDEGKVKERSMDDLIKADRYLAQKAIAAQGIPFGMRISRIRPGGTTESSY